DDETPQENFAALGIGRVDAVVADLGIRHRDDLSAVRRIGQDFLVTGHARIEYDFAVDLAVGPESQTGENFAIFEGQFGTTDHEPCTVVSKQGETSAAERRRSFECTGRLTKKKGSTGDCVWQRRQT